MIIILVPSIGHLEGSEMVYPRLPKQIQQKSIRENYVDPLDPFLQKNIPNPTTQDPHSKIQSESKPTRIT